MGTEIIELLNFLQEAEKLKTTLRHSWLSSGRQESVAEHTWRTTLMALVLQDKIPQININRVIKLLIVHDIGEIDEGDIPAFDTKKKQWAFANKIEKKTVKRLAGILKNETGQRILSLWTEFFECQTAEAKLARALDKLETLIQHNEADISTWTEVEFSFNLTYGKKYMDVDEFILEIRKMVDEKIHKKIDNR